MSLVIALFVLVLLGFILFGYSMNRGNGVRKDEAMKSGKQVRREHREY